MKFIMSAICILALAACCGWIYQSRSDIAQAQPEIIKAEAAAYVMTVRADIEAADAARDRAVQWFALIGLSVLCAAQTLGFTRIERRLNKMDKRIKAVMKGWGK